MLWLILGIGFRTALGIIVQPEWKIYYDLRTNKSIDTIDTSNPRQQLYRHFMKQLRIGFGPIPCSCQDLTCGCCAGMAIETFQFNRRACMNFTYDPMQFALNMNMYMNDENLFSQSVSAKNPPPVCMPAPLPPVLPSVDFCLRFFNIHTPGYNIFMCVDFETRMERAPILVLHFDCMEFGQDGISYHKPEELDYAPEEAVPAGGQEIDQGEVYDEVLEDCNATSTHSMKSLINEEGDGNKEEVFHEEEI